MPKVFMVQVYDFKWRIINERGVILCDDIQVPRHEAELYVRNWVSSFHGWTYEVIFLPKEQSND